MIVPTWVFTFLITVLVLILLIVVVVLLILLLTYYKGVEMPNPNDYDDRDSFMEACIPMRISEGDSQERAVAACSGMWDNKSEVFKGIIFKDEPSSK